MHYNRLALVQKEICAELAELLAEFCEPSESCHPAGVRRALEIGAGTGFLSSHLLRLYPQAAWSFNDISQAAESYISDYAPKDAAFLWGDAEVVDFPCGQDLIASASTMQWFDDQPRFIERAAVATNIGGWLAVSTFGPDNFREIRDTTGEGLSYYTLAELEQILSEAGYEVLSSREYKRTMHFASPLEVLHHIKATGVNSLGHKRWGRGQFADFDRTYKEKHASAEGVVLTYHPILLVAQKV